MDFAQDFAKEYLTYEKGGEQDFRTRINPYISQRLNNAPGIYAFRNNAKAAYVNAYRKEQEGEVYNVYVNAEIQYDKGEDGMEYADCTLKILLWPRNQDIVSLHYLCIYRIRGTAMIIPCLKFRWGRK